MGRFATCLTPHGFLKRLLAGFLLVRPTRRVFCQSHASPRNLHLRQRLLEFCDTRVSNLGSFKKKSPKVVKHLFSLATGANSAGSRCPTGVHLRIGAISPELPLAWYLGFSPSEQTLPFRYPRLAHEMRNSFRWQMAIVRICRLVCLATLDPPCG